MIFKNAKKIITGEKLFFAAFIARLFITVWYTTMFPPVDIVRKLALLTVLACCAAKIAFFDRFTISEILVMAVVGGCIALNVFKTGSKDFSILFLLVIAAKGIDFRKIIKVYLLVAGSIVLFAFLCSGLDVIENLRYYQEDKGFFRNSCGIIYCTDFAAHVFYLVLAYFYLRGKKLRWFDYLGTVVLTIFVYYLSRGKLDSACMVMTVCLFAVGNAVTNDDNGIKGVLRHNWISFWRYMSPGCMIIASVIMIVLTCIYDPDINWMNKLNSFITYRLYWTNKTLVESGYSLFGQKIKLIGFGGTTVKPDEYNFPDCSYLYILIASGLAILIIVLVAYTYGTYRNRSDLYLMYAVVLISINCMIAHHLHDIAYNPFTFMIMAGMTGDRTSVIYDPILLTDVKAERDGTVI